MDRDICTDRCLCSIFTIGFLDRESSEDRRFYDCSRGRDQEGKLVEPFGNHRINDGCDRSSDLYVGIVVFGGLFLPVYDDGYFEGLQVIFDRDIKKGFVNAMVRSKSSI